MANALDLIFYSAGATAIMAVPFLIVNCARYLKTRSRAASSGSDVAVGFPVKSVGFFVAPILITAAVATVATTSARREALEFLRESTGNVTVYVNHQPVPDGDKVLSALRDIAPYWAHHSHPTRRIRVEVRSAKGKLALELGRDSGNPQEYWVFCPAHGITSNNEIGRITTSVFDRY